MSEVHELTWMKDAVCRDENPELFFPHERSVAGIEAAKKVCELCPVQTECLDFALADPLNSAFGVWGNKDQNERREIIANTKLRRTRRNSGRKTTPTSEPSSTAETNSDTTAEETATALGILALEL